MGFWKIIEKYNIDNIGILDSINKPFDFDNIGSVYKFFNNNSIFCLKYKLKRFCSLCTYNINLEEYFNSYITINLEELNKYKNIEDKIHDLLTHLSMPNRAHIVQIRYHIIYGFGIFQAYSKN